LSSAGSVDLDIRASEASLAMIALHNQALVGRVAELATIQAVIDARLEGRGDSVVIIGEGGIGKSHLCRDTQDRAAHAGMVVLSGRAVEGGPAEPFRPLAEAIASGFRAKGPPEDPSLLPFRGTLAHLIPSWARAPAPLASVVALGEAVLHLLAIVAKDAGALLVIEDLHWADDDLLAVLEYLVDNAAAHGASCLLTLRPEPEGSAQRLVRRLADRRAATLLSPGPLGPADTDELVRRCLDADAVPDELLTFVRERSDGVPFFVEELLLGLIRSGALVAGPHGWQLVAGRLATTVPPALGSWVAQRLRSLSPQTQRVVAAAALLGQPFDWSLLPSATGLDEAVVLAALREATYAQLLAGDGDTMRFRHSLTRDHVLADMLPPERVALAAATLTTVVDRHPDLPGHWCDLAAELAELAGDTQAAAEHLITSARRARRRGALSTAAARLGHAIQLLPEGTARWTMAHRLLAEVRAIAGDVEAALEHAELAGWDDPAGQGDLHLTLAQALLGAGRLSEARRHLTAAQQVGSTSTSPASSPIDDVARARPVLLAAELAIAEQDLEAATTLATSVLEVVGLPPEFRCQALEILGRCTRVHDVGEAQQRFEDALATADTHGLVLWRARALHELGTIDLLDRMRLDRLEAARRAGIEAGAPALAAIADLHLAAALVSSSETVAAREAAQRAEQLAHRLGHAVEPWATMMVARTFAHERRADDAEETIARALARSEDPALEAQAYGHVRAMLALHRADRQGALVMLDRSIELLRRLPGQHDPYRGLWALLRTLAGDRDAEAREEVAHAAGSDTRFNVALLEVAHAVAAGREGDHDLADRRQATGLALVAGYERGELLLHLTTWICAPAALSDGWGEPISWLTDGLRWFADHGHDPLATSCRTLLRDTGAVVPRQGRGTSTVPLALQRQGVTSREADVLWLLGERLTNAQIAERLVLSPRTIEKHVAALLRKTGAVSRGALGRLATDLAQTADR
jgi:DNA-binding CsgD family transcriptional regulator/tetratricopeptide (TPR) repeat protein